MKNRLRENDKNKNKSKGRERLRLLIQAAFFALTNGYVRGFAEKKIYSGKLKALCVPGLNCYSCPGAVFSCPIGALQAIMGNRSFNISCYVMGIISLFGLFMGRFVCGFLCPFGLVQDLLYKIPFFVKLKNLPLHRFAKYLKFLILLFFVMLFPMIFRGIGGIGQPWFCEYICPSGTLLGGIPLVLLNGALRSIIGIRYYLKLAILLIIIILSVIAYRPFCKYLCPLGAIYGLFNKVSFYRYTVDGNSCIKCGKCNYGCPMDIKVWENPNSIECIRCGRCISECPVKAIKLNYGIKDRG